MTNTVLCDEFAERLADLLERDVDEATRAALEAHALSCDECGALLADLRKVRIDASSLPALTPSRDLWKGIADRIDAPVIPLHVAAGETVTTSRRWRRWSSLAAAAAVLVAVTSITTRYFTMRTQQSGSTAIVASRDLSDSAVRDTAATSSVAARPDDTASTPRSAETVTPATARNATRLVSNKVKPSAEQVYATEIDRLHRIVEQRRSQLDPITVSVIERNLKVIDDAIAQCRVALDRDPASRFLMQSLNNALETKVELLRTAALLPARS
jgi:hypothetical protein